MHFLARNILWIWLQNRHKLHFFVDFNQFLSNSFLLCNEYYTHPSS